jgi:RNA-binding protein Musashi
VEVKWAVPKHAMELANRPPAEQRKLFIGGLSPITQQTDLMDHFNKYGVVEDAVVMQDHNTKRPRGFGFVTFTTSAAAKKVRPACPPTSVACYFNELCQAIFSTAVESE